MWSPNHSGNLILPSRSLLNPLLNTKICFPSLGTVTHPAGSLPCVLGLYFPSSCLHQSVTHSFDTYLALLPMVGASVLWQTGLQVPGDGGHRTTLMELTGAIQVAT